MRVLYGLTKTMTIGSGFRNPVHNWVHVHLQQHKFSAWRSRHQFGGAVDLDTGKDSTIFYEMSRAGAKAGACMEPPLAYLIAAHLNVDQNKVLHYDHVHAEWDPGAPCPPSMMQWGQSLLPQN